MDSQNKCMQLIASSKTTIMEVTKLLGKLSFTAQTVLPRRIQCRYLQQQQIQAVRELNSYQTKKKIKPTVTGRAEVVEGKFTFSKRQTTEYEECHSKAIVQTIGIPQLIIQTNASKTGWGQPVREPLRENLVISGKVKI